MVDFPITIFRGVTFGPFTLYAKDSVGAVLNLTGYTVAAHIRATLASSFLLHDLTPVITNVATGEITIERLQAVTLLLDFDEGVWDLIIINSALKRLGPYVGGRVDVLWPATRLG